MSLVYADKPQTLDYLEDNIHRVIAYIRPQMLEKVIENWTSRLDYIRASRGSPMPEIIFKITTDVSAANGTMKGRCVLRNGMRMSLLASHASVCNTTMVGSSLETTWREDAKQLRFATPHWSCTGFYGMGRY
ncbi:hypothetical protein TNCV_1991261 [Trichonephila clavipes]|nr:hypothetical protein TNCV_1991261 [Trichonephila clavipes]